jgi:hypothetical protein
VAPGFVFADARLDDPYQLPRSVVRRDTWQELYAFLERNARSGGGGRIIARAPAGFIDGVQGNGWLPGRDSADRAPW